MLKTVKVLERAATGVAVVALMALIVISVVNALGRTWFGASVYAANEIASQWLLPTIVLLSIPGTQVFKENYVVSILTERLTGRLLGLLKVTGYVTAVIICLALAWFGLLEALENTSNGATAGITTLPTYPFYFLVPAGMVLAALVFACDAVLAHRHPDGELNTGTGRPLHHDYELAETVED